MPTYWVDCFNTTQLLTVYHPNGVWMSKNGEKDNSNVPPDRKTIIIQRVERDTALSYSLKELYNNQCQICGSTIQLAGGLYSEVHHLKPLGEKHSGHDIKSNMIVVCPNHHTQLDYGAIAIIPDTFKIITFEGNEIGSLFVAKNHTIDKEFLEYHLKNIFKQGKFEKSA